MQMARANTVGGLESGLARALWWAYERAPAPVDSLFQLGRRYFMPILRHRLPVHRLTGRTEAGGAAVTVITVGGAMTLDALVGRLFLDPPQREAVDAAPLTGLPRALEALAGSADLVLACVPRAYSGWSGERYLRVPTLVGARLPLAPSREATLARATRTVRYDVRRVPLSGYRWSYSTAPACFERFYDEFYCPFIAARFGQLAVIRERQVLRRHFRKSGGLVWLRHGSTTIGAELVREHGRDLRLLVQALHPQWPNRLKPSAQIAFNVASIEHARKLGLGALDFGGSLPWPTDGIFASKRAWGVAFETSPESHRDILLRWRSPLAPGFRNFLRSTPLLFETNRRLCVLGAFAPDAAAGDRPPDGLNPRLIPRGVHGTFVLGGTGWPSAPRTISTGVVALQESASPEMINRAAADAVG
jgi:hypothetical protein